MISYIVPVYNAEKTIERCVASILCQQCSGKEIILINDGSKDGSLEILRALEAQHSEVHVIDKPNGGVSSARNAGLKICTGKYVTFIDSDDYYLTENYTADMERLLDENEDAELVVSGFTMLTGAKEIAYAANKHTKDIVNLAEEFWQYRKTEVMNTVWNKMFRTCLIQDEFPENMTMGEDAVFVLRYLENCHRVIFDDNCSYGYVYELNSSTAEFRKKVAYDMRQSGIYYDALHSFWKRFLPEQSIALPYVQMKTDEVYTMIRSLLFKNGFAAYFKRDITEVIGDALFVHYYPIAKDRLDSYPHRKLARAVAASAAKQVKIYCLFATAKGIIRARLGKR